MQGGIDEGTTGSAIGGGMKNTKDSSGPVACPVERSASPAKLCVEFNPKFQRAHDTVGSLIITPPIDEDYWIARAVLFKDQAIQCFPKFYTVGCGFAQEEDWNTNLPLQVPAQELYQHIKHNKKYEEITEDMCLQAIRILQAALSNTSTTTVGRTNE